ncbi:MAG: FHA domain-containing protein [Chloroflexi bacterium]|nr:FHA domain-containing protein [Chloroflexota bacterium]
MAGIAPADLAALLIRLVFVVVLYVLVLAVLVTLRNDVLAPAARSAPLPSATPRRARLVLLETAADGGAHGRRASHGGGDSPGGSGSAGAPAAGGPNGASGCVIVLDGSVTVGRRAPSDVIVSDDSVSAKHARFSAAGDTWRVEDLGSTNGTYVNGHRVERSAALHSGDVVSTGMTSWRFESGT